MDHRILPSLLLKTDLGPVCYKPISSDLLESFLGLAQPPSARAIRKYTRKLRAFDPGNQVHRFNKVSPAVALCSQNLLAFGGQTVIAPAPLSSFLNPASLDPLPVFEAIKQGIQ